MYVTDYHHNGYAKTKVAVLMGLKFNQLTAHRDLVSPTLPLKNSGRLSHSKVVPP